MPAVVRLARWMIVCSLAALGATTTGSYSMYLDLSTLGVATTADIAGLDVVEL